MKLQIDEVVERRAPAYGSLQFGILPDIGCCEGRSADAGKVLGELFVIEQLGARNTHQLDADAQNANVVNIWRARLLDRAAADLAAALSGVIHVSSLFELDKEFFCADGFHPSQMGYAAWGERLAEAIVRA